MNYLKHIDQGVNFQLYHGSNNKQFKTVFGGITTLSVYTLILLYLILKLNQWINHDQLPSVTQLYVNQYEQNFSTFSSIKLKFPNSTINPFDLGSNLLIPVLYKFNNNEIESRLELLSNISNNELNIDIFMSTKNYTYSVTLEMCNQTYNIPGLKCSNNDQLFEQYEMQSHPFILEFKLKQFNAITTKVEPYNKQYSMLVDKQLKQSNTIILKQGKSIMYDGQIMQTVTKDEYLQEIEIQTQFFISALTQNQFTLQGYTPDVKSFFWFTLSTMQMQTQIQYQTFPQAMAEIGSIISLLMMILQIVQIIDQKLLENHLVNEIISYFYPQVKQLKIQKNIWGTIINISSTDDQKKYETQNFIKIYEKAEQLALKKLDILNIIYEISRIQFVLQQIQQKDLITQSKRVGIQIPLKIIKQNSKEKQKLKQKVSPDQQQDEELKIISLCQTVHHKKLIEAQNIINKTDEQSYLQNWKLQDLDMEILMNQ